MEGSFPPDGKYYRRLLLPAGVVAVVLAIVLAFVLVRAEKNNDWLAAQASLVTILLLLALMLCGLWALRHHTPRMSREAEIYHGATHKLLLCVAIGYLALLLNATRWDHWQYGIVAKAIGYGSLVAGAFFVLGVLFGYLFGLRPSSSVEKSPDGRPNPHTNLEEIADWFTKLILGAGLVELTSLRGPLGEFAEFMATGVDPSPPVPSGYRGSPAIALAIMLFFSASGVLYGYLWTRYELAAKDLPDADTSAPPSGSQVEPADPK